MCLMLSSYERKRGTRTAASFHFSPKWVYMFICGEQIQLVCVRVHVRVCVRACMYAYGSQLPLFFTPVWSAGTAYAGSQDLGST